MTIDIIMNVSLFFLVAALGVGLWGMVERNKFIRFEGPMKRGMKIGGRTLSVEEAHFLREMRKSFRQRGWFIRKLGREALIVDQRAWAHFGGRRRREPWAYAGYVDLRQPQPRLEFRAQWSSLAMFVMLFAIYGLAFWGFYTSVDAETAKGIWLFAPLVMGISLAALAFTHFQTRVRVEKVLKNAVEHKNSKLKVQNDYTGT